MDKYIVLCFGPTRERLTEYKTSEVRKACRFYEDAIKQGSYSSVTLRIDKRTHGYAIKSWSVENGEVLLHL